MVKSILPGGNWKDIPLDIPSKRLENIRKTGGRTTLYGRLSWDKPSYTITTYFNRPGNGAYIHPVQDRVLSAREAARLQSFPDNYIFEGSKTSLCKQIGNSVPPLLAYSIGKKIKEVAKVSKVLDLFCGAGGLSKGFEWAGYNIVAANDILKSACDTYRRNHKNTYVIEGDITKDEVKNKLLEKLKSKNVDIVIGGPPCQGFSYAGKRMIDDPRNFLFKEFVEIVSKIKPRVVLLENVEGILTSNKGKTYKSIKKSFESLNYSMEGRKIHAVKYGVPQKRKRVILIGILGKKPEKCFPGEIIQDEENFITVRDALSDLPSIKGDSNMIYTYLSKPKSGFQRLMRNEMLPNDFTEKITKTS